MSVDIIQDVKDFQNKFGVHMNSKPTFLSDDLNKFRLDFIQEEFDELKKAVEEKDMVEVLDALVDITYVVSGMASQMGLPFNEAWDEVQKTNMAKVSGKDAIANSIQTTKKPRHESDVLKPLDWQAPRLKEILEEAGY